MKAEAYPTEQAPHVLCFIIPIFIFYIMIDLEELLYIHDTSLPVSVFPL